MRILLAALAVVSLAGCATNFYSSLDDPGDNGHSRLVVGDVEIVKSSFRQAIQAKFPKCRVSESFDGTFTWSINIVDYRLTMFVGTGRNEDSREIKGYFYTLKGDPILDHWDTTPLIEAMPVAFSSNGLTVAKVSLLSKKTMLEEAQLLADQAQACFADIADDAKLAGIKNKVSFGTAADQPFAMLSDASKPAPEEKEAIRMWGQVREKCLALQRTANKALGTDPQIKVLMDSLVTNQQNLIAQLFLGNLTYGDFAQKRQSLANNFRESAANVEAQLKNQERESQERMAQVEATRALSSAINSTALSLSRSGGPTTCSFVMNTMYCN